MEKQELFVCVVELHITVNNEKNNVCCVTMLIWCVYVAGNNKTYFGLDK